MANTITVPYGAYELKKTYQRNFAIAVLVSSGAFLIAFGILYFILTYEPPMPEAAPTIITISAADMEAPPPLKELPRMEAFDIPQVQAPTIGIPQAVPDEQAPEEVDIATQEDLALMVAPPVERLEDQEGVEIVIMDVEDLLPTPDEFIPYDEAPVAVKSVEPDYPELARQIGLEGSVWLKALVDKKGKVRDVIILKDSGANAGFEEAAKEAAYKHVYKPAISNGQPLAVWVAYKVNFKIK